jgi:hypothetical protein
MGQMGYNQMGMGQMAGMQNQMQMFGNQMGGGLPPLHQQQGQGGM